MAQSSPTVELYRVREAFAVPAGDGMLRSYAVGAMIASSDPIAGTHRAFLEAASNAVEQATAAPGERRSAGLILPSGVRQPQAVAHRTGHAHLTEGATNMVHTLPPEDVNSAASPFAPSQPGMGVVADDVPDSQNLAGAPKAADVSVEAAEAAVKESAKSGKAKVVEAKEAKAANEDAAADAEAAGSTSNDQATAAKSRGASKSS